MTHFKYLYGPVFSWRLGCSLGVDLISTKDKSCNFDCEYCQIGHAEKFVSKQKVFVKTVDIVSELEKLDVTENIDFLTFSGRGEPTLAKNLGEVVKEISKIEKLKDKKTALITNSSLIYLQEVQDAIKDIDVIMAKFDVWGDFYLQNINNPSSNVSFGKIYEGLKSFRRIFKGKLELQVMFVAKNKTDYKKIIPLIKNIAPDRVHINTPLRPCGIKPLNRVDIEKIKKDFEKWLGKFGIKVESVYDVKKEAVLPIDKESTYLRRGTE